MMMGMGKFNGAVRKGSSVDERLKNLIELKGNQMIGCEYCVDLGSQICRHSGLSDEEILALPNYRSSKLFDDREKVALDYAVAVMRTPVEMTDDLFARMREHFTEKQIVEITAHITVVNLDRFNVAFGIGFAGFSEGMVCLALTGQTSRPNRSPRRRPTALSATSPVADARIAPSSCRARPRRERSGSARLTSACVHQHGRC
jgi:hypothetical protein